MWIFTLFALAAAVGHSNAAVASAKVPLTLQVCSLRAHMILHMYGHAIALMRDVVRAIVSR